MIRFTLIALVLFSTLDASAQRDSSLTEDFGKLSARQRTKIAQQEQEDAARDVEFQEMMRDAEKLFQAREYDLALARYKDARKKRPYNVHPKVKIQDLEIYIKERDRKAAERSAPAPAIEIELKTPDPPSAKSTSGSTATVPARSNGARSTASPVVDRKKVDAPKSSQIDENVTDRRIEGERIYKEAGSVVIERIVMEQRRPVTYKKVVQRSGATFHFRDGEMITSRVWGSVFQ